MKKKCEVRIMPVYRYEDLTEKQFRALSIKAMDYPNEYYSKDVQISTYGGKNVNGDLYHFMMELYPHVKNRDIFTVDRSDVETDDTLVLKTENLLNGMDAIAEEFDKIIEALEES